MKRLFYLIFIFILFNCTNKKDTIEYHQNLDLIWEIKNINWNATSLTVNKGSIYGHKISDSIFKLDFKTGKVIWEKYLKGTYSNESPKIQKEKIFFSGAENIKAFNKNGELLWSEITNSKTIGLTINDNLIFNTRTNEGLFANSIKSGKEVWSIKPKYQMLSMSNPSMMDSLLILGNFDYKENIGSHLTCINIENQEIKWEIENKGYLNGESIIEKKNLITNSDSAYQKGFTTKLDLITGKTLWKTDTNPIISYKSKVYNHKVFVPSYKNGIVCINNETGKILWKLNQNFCPNTELVFHKNVLFFGTVNRKLIGINEKGETVFKSDFEYGIGNPFIYENNIYINDGKGRLFRIKNTVANTI
ncbi:MAG: PQQ-binding-like beta-propeller repeat protein [Flavobacteriaceae bacterium]